MPAYAKPGVDHLNVGMGRLRVEDRGPAPRRSALGSMMQHELGNMPESPSKHQQKKEEDGFTTVSKQRRPDKPAVSFVEPPRAGRERAAKSSVYQPRPKQASHLKQECLPVDERDPHLLEAQTNGSKTMAKEQYRPGLIIRGLLHEQDYMASSSRSQITVVDKSKHDTRYGSVCTKWRKMIVVGCYQDHYTAIPLFTHNGTGLEYKKAPDEFISIKDPRWTEHVSPLSNHKPLKIASINKGIDVFSPKSTAHITYCLPRKYDLPVVREGELTKPSLNNLIYLFNRYAPREIQGGGRDG